MDILLHVFFHSSSDLLELSLCVCNRIWNKPLHPVLESLEAVFLLTSLTDTPLFKLVSDCTLEFLYFVLNSLNSYLTFRWEIVCILFNKSWHFNDGVCMLFFNLFKFTDKWFFGDIALFNLIFLQLKWFKRSRLHILNCLQVFLQIGFQINDICSPLFLHIFWQIAKIELDVGYSLVDWVFKAGDNCLDLD